MTASQQCASGTSRRKSGDSVCARLPLALICALLMTMPGVGHGASDDEDPTAQLLKLQSVLFAYADKYMSAIAQATILSAQRNPSDTQLRLRMHGLKLVVGASVQDLAAAPNPESTLLDMMVFASLHRMVFESKAGSAYYGEAAPELTKLSRKLEKEIWDIARGYLNAQQMAEVHQMIRDWRADNPDVLVVSYIRFNDFASLRSASPLVERATHSGFIVDLSGAEQAVDKTLLLAERVLHYSQRLPWIMEWQFEKVFYQLAVEPEVQVSLAQTQRLNDSLERYADSLEKLPKQISAERRAGLKQMTGAISAEREAFFAGLDARQNMLQETFSATRGSLVDANTLAINLQKTTSTINEALINADKLVAHFDTGPKPEDADSKPFDINVYVHAIEQLTIALREANALVLSTSNLADPTGATSGVVNSVLWTGSILILVLCVAVFITMLIYRAAARHIVPRSSFEYVGPTQEKANAVHSEVPTGKS